MLMSLSVCLCLLVSVSDSLSACLFLRATASIWFEIWGVVDPSKKAFDFLGKF